MADDGGRPTIAPLSPAGVGGGAAPDRPVPRPESIPILNPDRLRRSPTCVIVVGMAGSGKTTLVAQLQRSLDPPAAATAEAAAEAAEDEKVKVKGKDGGSDGVDGEGKDEGVAEGSSSAKKADGPPSKGGEEDAPRGGANGSEAKKKKGYCVNLDPATKLVPYGASIDIRDTVDYKEVMHQHNLGPNGAIMTSLNLFVTKFDQVMGILERRAFGNENDDVGGNTVEEEAKQSDGSSETTPSPLSTKVLDYILVDTPGQIEAFSWSASGTIISESLASAFPTVLAFVVDTPRCAASPHTFMSNMLYACSMSYRTRLPLVIVFNKTDVVPSSFAEEWMADYDAFQEALDEMGTSSYASGDEGSGYYASLTRSLGLVLDEFYTTLHRVGVSAATGDGVDQFWEAVDRAAVDFQEEYVEDLRDRLAEREARERAKARVGVRKFARDVGEEVDGSTQR